MKDRLATRPTGSAGDRSAEQQESPLADDLTRAHALATARTHFEKARLALEMGKPRLAVTLLESCLQVEADHPEYLGLWGYAQTLIGGDLKAARQACQRALDARTYEATLHTQLGVVLQASGRKDEARVCFENALQRDPQQKLASRQLQTLNTGSGGFSLRNWWHRLRR